MLKRLLNTTHRHHGWCALTSFLPIPSITTGAKRDHPPTSRVVCRCPLQCSCELAPARTAPVGSERVSDASLLSELVIVLIIIDLYQYQVSLSDLSPRMTIQADQCHLVAASCPSVPPATTCQDVIMIRMIKLIILN